MKIAVIGAGGFVGKALTHRLVEDGDTVVPIVRTPGHFSEERRIGDLNAADWPQVLARPDVVVLTAARVHVMNERASDPLAEFLRVNRDGACSALRGAADAGARRFVFVSTVKVNGEGTDGRGPFTWKDTPAPLDPYGLSKLEAERALAEMAAERQIELTIVRPTLVYGPGVGANFANMMRWIRRGVPLPLGAITHNRRSLVSIDNLVDLLAVCSKSPTASGQTFFASDGEDMSTTELLRRVGKALRTPVRLLPVPTPLLTAAGAALGKQGTVRRLTDSLQVDIAHNRDVLGWSPPMTVDEGLRRTADAFLGS